MNANHAAASETYSMSDEELTRRLFGPKKTISNTGTTTEHTTAPKTIYDLPIAAAFWDADARDLNC